MGADTAGGKVYCPPPRQVPGDGAGDGVAVRELAAIDFDVGAQPVIPMAPAVAVAGCGHRGRAVRGDWRVWGMG